MESVWGLGATAPSKDPIVHLLRRFTYGPTKDLVSEVSKIGADAWFEKQLDHLKISDTEVNFLLKQGKITYQDFGDNQQFTDANGDVSIGTIIYLKEVRVLRFIL